MTRRRYRRPARPRLQFPTADGDRRGRAAARHHADAGADCATCSRRSRASTRASIIGSAEVRGLSMETPEGPFRLAAIRLANLDNGKLAEFALEGLEARAPQGPVKVGRFALKSLDVANLMRMSAQFAASRRQPAPGSARRAAAAARRHRDQGLVAPYKDTGQAGQHRHAEPVMGPVRRTDPDARARHAEDVRPGRPDRSRAVQRARRRRDRPARRSISISAPRGPKARAPSRSSR